MFSFHFYRWNQFIVMSLACTLRTRKLPKFLVTFDVRYWVNQVRRYAGWLTDVEEKQT